MVARSRYCFPGKRIVLRLALRPYSISGEARPRAKIALGRAPLRAVLQPELDLIGHTRNGQKFNLSASWIWRMAFDVDVILPKVEAGAGLEPFPQLNWPLSVNSTWLGALNI